MPSASARAAGAASGSRAALFVLNPGIGNLVMLGPVLEQLERAWPQLAYHLVTVADPHEPWFADSLRLRRLRDPSPPAIWRRFSPEIASDFIGFLARHGIDLVVNLRNATPHLDGDYFAFRDLATPRGVEFWDVHELDAATRRSAFASQIVELLRRHGVPLAAPRTTWLAQRRRPRAGVVGAFVGASRGVRRWRPVPWAAALRRLLDEAPARVEVAAGPAEPEQALAAAVVEEAGDARVRTVAPCGIDGLVDWIGSVEALASSDTAASHLAAAVGTPLVTLFFCTVGAIWSPAAASDRYVALQSEIGLRCRAMKPDGTCLREDLGCPAPCRRGVKPDDVAAALGRLRSVATNA